MAVMLAQYVFPILRLAGCGLPGLLAAGGLLAAAPGPPVALELTVRADARLSKSGGDDIGRLQRLAGGVGWEFSPNKLTADKLRQLGMRTIRCINVDPLPGRFDETGAYVFEPVPARLDAHLQTCRELGANPHIILAQGVPEVLRLSPAEVQARTPIMGQSPAGHTYWNGDWARLRAYWKAYFRLVVIDCGFSRARFEVGNEPDINGQFPRLAGKQGAMGSRALYQAYLEVYRNASQAAQEFEAEHPGAKVTLGGPALAWAYSFKYGELNWATEFIKDVAAAKLKLDFLGVHFYGNIASLHGEYPAGYPPLAEMLATTQNARDRYLPGLAIEVTEWGASYHTNNRPEATVNANPIGAAWSAAFLNQLLESGVRTALYLVTTDGQARDPAGAGLKNVWGWPSLFVNPVQFGQPWPKAPAHLFSMIHVLAPQRVVLEGIRLESGINGIASTHPTTGEITVLLWNYQFQIPEGGLPVDMGAEAMVTLRTATNQLDGAPRPMRLERWLVSADTSNALAEFQATGRITSASELQRVEAVELQPSAATHAFRLPTGSLTLVHLRRSP